MTSSTLTLRNATADDIAQILAVQHQCYHDDFHESDAAFASKIASSTDTCWLALQGEQTLAYLVTLPVTHATLPALHAPDFVRAPTPQLLYVHDLAVAPAGRALRLGQQLLQQAFAAAVRMHIPQLALIAVQDSIAYWTRHGFAVVDADALPAGVLEKVASFGENARYMEKPTHPAG